MIAENLQYIHSQLPESVKLIAVSKTKPVSDIQEAYNCGQRAFGENKAQEMLDKFESLPRDIEWHMIGHMQTNKVKYIAPFVALIHSVDSLKLLEVINKEAQKNNRIIDCLLQIYIAREESKFGLDKNELLQLTHSESFIKFSNIRIRGFMGMATYTENENTIRNEFRFLKNLYLECKESIFSNQPHFDTLSMGMSGDYRIAIEEGSTMVRIGSDIFGQRIYQK